VCCARFVLFSAVLIIIQLGPEAVNDRELFTAGCFGVREKYCSDWKFTIVYDQANRLIISQLLNVLEIRNGSV